MPWLAPRAIELFDAGFNRAWDEQHGGLYYGFGPDDTMCDHDKYFWVQAETFAAAALLGKRTGRERFWDWYDELWRYSWAHFVDHEYGAWYPHPHLRQPQVRRRKEPRRQDRLPHDGRVLRSAERELRRQTPHHSRDATKTATKQQRMKS